MRRGLRSIDIYQAVPSQLGQGTVSGALITCLTIFLLSLLLFSVWLNYTNVKIVSDLIIDQKHLDQKLKVVMDIQFPNYPCSMLSLDIENQLGLHQVNIGNTIQKYKLPEMTLFQESKDEEERKRRINHDFQVKNGCRMKGWFEIDRVPGNFHFSGHGYMEEIEWFVNQGNFDEINRLIDFTHIIHRLSFGNNQDFQLEALSEFHSRKEIDQNFLGISYIYFLEIMQRNQFKILSEYNREEYPYTVRMNEVILADYPIILFNYETNPITMLVIQDHMQLHQLFVKVVGIVGGVVTVASIVDGLIHSSFHFLMEKRRLNKLI